MYPSSRWIFIGAKLSDKDNKVTKQREQQIKGVLAHELCHYVMRLVYDNQVNPYYKNRKDMKEMFEEIVKIIDKWSSKGSVGPDDECNGIISSVFTSYPSKNFHPELIVRAVQILSEFDDSEDKTRHLQEKYKILFEFWSNQVIPELQRYLQKNLEIIELNGILDLLPYITKLKYELCDGKDMENMMNNKVVIVKSNVPKLLFLNILKCLQKKCGNLFSSQNIFTEPEKLLNQQIWDKFTKICSENQELRIFVDCSKKIPDFLGNIFDNKDPSFIFVVSTDEQTKKLSGIFNRKAIKADIKMEINYNWNDLTEESQKRLRVTKINNSQISLMDLLTTNASTEEPTTSKIAESVEEKLSKDLCDVIDVHFLNLVLENQNVLINRIEKDEKYFQFLFKPRNFIKKTRITEEECNLKNKHENPDSSDNSLDEDSEEENSILKRWKQRLQNERRHVLHDGVLTHKIVRMSSQMLADSSNKVEQLKVKKHNEFQFLSYVKNKQYVLISDQAGNGKSWAMKHITKQLREQHPTSWVTYVDLKQFIKVFEAQMVQKGKPEFSTFMADHILNPQKQFEANIFKKMYMNGKVFILFDGFDEIAPNYAEFVLKLAQNFQSNGGNQLWIATRDYFEVDLQEKLKLDVAYRLDEMTEDEGVDLIARSWVFMSLKDKSEPKSKEEFEECIKVSPNVDVYKRKAHKIVEKGQILRNNSVGLPQLYKMIADGFKDEDNVGDLQGVKIYVKFIDILYTRWSDQKGQIRKQANVNSQRFQLNFHRFHQYQAILSLFPKLAPILFPGYNGSEWPEEEVIACGILTKRNGKYYFIHETFREFYVADAIANALRNDNVDEKVLETLDEVLTVNKFNIIRKFLLPVLNETSILEKVKLQIENSVCCEGSFCFVSFFIYSLENLADFAIDVLKNESYEKVKAILNKNAWNIARYTQSSNLFSKFLDLIKKILKVNDLKALIINGKLFKGITESCLDIEIFEDFVIKTEEKTGPLFIQQLLMPVSICINSIFSFMSLSSNLNTQKVNKFLKIMEKFLTGAEIIELMKKCNNYKHNVLQVCIEFKKEENFKILWREINFFFVKQNFLQSFSEFVKQQDIRERSILQSAASCNNIEFHETLWRLLLKTFENREELKDFILQIDVYKINFVHELVRESKNPAIIELTFRKLNENFNKDQFQEILTSMGEYEMNLLQSAACKSNVLEVHQLLWKFFQDFCGTDEKFLEMLTRVDKNGLNILHGAAQWSSSEVFEFMIQELEKIASRDKTRETLRNANIENQNLLQRVSNVEHFFKSKKFFENIL